MAVAKKPLLMADLKGRVYKAKEKEFKPPFFYSEEIPEFMQQREKLVAVEPTNAPPPNIQCVALPVTWRG